MALQPGVAGLMGIGAALVAPPSNRKFALRCSRSAPVRLESCRFLRRSLGHAGNDEKRNRRFLVYRAGSCGSVTVGQALIEKTSQVS